MPTFDFSLYCVSEAQLCDKQCQLWQDLQLETLQKLGGL
jgi:hypothetical protein